jgi:hypothetical protein
MFYYSIPDVLFVKNLPDVLQKNLVRQVGDVFLFSHNKIHDTQDKTSVRILRDPKNLKP